MSLSRAGQQSGSAAHASPWADIKTEVTERLPRVVQPVRRV